VVFLFFFNNLKKCHISIWHCIMSSVKDNVMWQWTVSCVTIGCEKFSSSICYFISVWSKFF